jgi:hypothetical protein
VPFLIEMDVEDRLARTSLGRRGGGDETRPLDTVGPVRIN